MQQIPKTMAFPVTPMRSGPKNSTYCVLDIAGAYEEQLSIRRFRCARRESGGGEIGMCERVKGQRYKYWLKAMARDGKDEQDMNEDEDYNLHGKHMSVTADTAH